MAGHGVGHVSTYRVQKLASIAHDKYVPLWELIASSVALTNAVAPTAHLGVAFK